MITHTKKHAMMRAHKTSGMCWCLATPCGALDVDGDDDDDDGNHRPNRDRTGHLAHSTPNASNIKPSVRMLILRSYCSYSTVVVVVVVVLYLALPLVTSSRCWCWCTPWRNLWRCAHYRIQGFIFPVHVRAPQCVLLVMAVAAIAAVAAARMGRQLGPGHSGRGRGWCRVCLVLIAARWARPGPAR